MTQAECWNQTGVEGDRSCEQLEIVNHCLNCPTYVAAGRRLLDRAVPADYLQQWTAAVAQTEGAIATLTRSTATTKPSDQETLSVMIFRLGNERFALPICILQEVTRPAAIHALPHRSNDLFLGLVNIRGEILPCVSLHQLLNVEMSIDPTNSHINLRRLIVMGREARWVFPVDEVYRVYRLQMDELQNVPVVVERANKAYTQGMIDWHLGKVNYLDADRLLPALNRLL